MTDLKALADRPLPRPFISLDPSTFVAIFGAVFEHSPWVAERTIASNPDAGWRTALLLGEAMIATMKQACREEQLALIGAHPDLAGKAALAGNLSENSTNEQASAGLDACTREELERLQSLNAAYSKKFGFPFIMAVKFASHQDIIQEMERRLDNHEPTEFATALEEIGKIALIRLSSYCNLAEKDARALKIMARCDILGQFSESDEGILRRYLSTPMRKVHDLAASWMRQAGLTVREDEAGNLIGRRESAGPDAPTILCGSHLDTVANAGKYDGVLGVMTAIETAEALAEFPLALEVIAFADEEGTRFGTSYLGSRPMATGELGIALDHADDEGNTVTSLMTQWGLDPLRVSQARRHPDKIAGYIELHIEQGPVLEAEDLPVAVVTGIAGQRRLRVTVTGDAGHAGTTPMKLRRDALAGAVEMASQVEASARRIDNAVATIGTWTVRPGGINVIPAEVAFTIDHRCPDDRTLSDLSAALEGSFKRIAQKRRLDVEIETLGDTQAVSFDPAIRTAIEQACVALTGRVMELPSGAGHDAAMMARLCRSAMIFVRCEKGLSHHPDENVRGDDVAVAFEVFRDAIQNYARLYARSGL